MKYKEYYGHTDYTFSGAIFIDARLQTHWDSTQLDAFLELLKEHNITEYSISQDLDEKLEKQIIVRVDYDAHTTDFEYDLTTMMIKNKVDKQV